MQTVNDVLHFDEAVIRRVVVRTEIVILHRVGAVQLGALKADPIVLHVAVLVLFRSGRSIIHVVAVDINPRVEVLRHKQHGHHRLRIGVLFGREVGFGKAHQRTLHDVAEFVGRRIILRAVDEVNVIALFDDKAAVGAYFSLNISGQRLDRVAIRTTRKRNCRRTQRRRGNHTCQFSELIPHCKGLLKNYVGREKKSAFPDNINAYSIIYQFVN